MNAFELYELAVDAKSVEQRSAFDYLPISIEDLQACYNGFLDKKIAEKIIAAHNRLFKENEKNGKFSSNYYYCVEQPLREIEL